MIYQYPSSLFITLFSFWEAHHYIFKLNNKFPQEIELKSWSKIFSRYIGVNNKINQSEDSVGCWHSASSAICRPQPRLHKLWPKSWIGSQETRIGDRNSQERWPQPNGKNKRLATDLLYTIIKRMPVWIFLSLSS